MRSSAGVIDAERRSALGLAVVALAALALALLLAFASTLLHRNTAPRGDAALGLRADTRAGAPARPVHAAPPTTVPVIEPAVSGGGELANAVAPASLWTLLTPWALAADALAVLGMLVVLAVRHAGRRPRGGSP